MSKGSTRELLHNKDRESINKKLKSWHCPDQPVNISQSSNRICTSPIDGLEAFMVLKLKYDDDNKSINVHSHFSDEHNVKKNTTQESDGKLYQVNDFDYIRLKKTGFNYEHDKLEATLADNMNTPEAFDESDVDQLMDFALCYSETDMEENQKPNLCLPKSDIVTHGDKMEAGKSKASSSKETTKNKKEMFSNPSKSFKEIFNFFKDRDKKKSNESTKPVHEPSKKVQKLPAVHEQRGKSPHEVEQHEKEVKSRAEASCSQETPLMFSRCSSLSSLSGIEHISVIDDRSSILSDFSRRTSGVVSPSELPDSPAQSIATSIKPPQKSHISCFGKKKTHLPAQLKVCPEYLTENSNLIHEVNIKKSTPNKYSVFEDHLLPFKDESTPTKIHSMAASSLSSLTIDDDDEDFMHKIILNKDRDADNQKLDFSINRQEPSGESNNLTDSSPKSELSNTSYSEQKEINVSEEEEEEEEEEDDDKLTDLTPYEEKLLDQCIRCGIAKWTKQNLNDINPFGWDIGLSCRAAKAIMTCKIRNNSHVDFENNIDKKKNIFINHKSSCDNVELNRYSLNNTQEEENYQNILHERLNENEPPNETENRLIENSYYVAYQEHLLDQCIRRGRAKLTKRNINDIRPFSWDIHQICLTTRAMGFPNHPENIFYGN